MSCLKILNHHKIGSGIFLSAIASVLFSFFFLNTNTFALTDIDTSSQTYVYVCGSNTGIVCSDYSFLHFKFSQLTLDNLTHYFIVYFNSDQIGRVNILSSSTFLLGIDYYFPIPSGSSSYSFETTGNLHSTLSYELVSSLSSGPAPSGSITLSQNGTYDVSSYADAVVDVPLVMGDYHDDLVNIYHAIMTCGAVCIVLYFFYCIYRMIIKSTGGT